MNSFHPGNWLKRAGYRSFEPSKIDRPWRIDDPVVQEALSKADRHLGRLDMFSEYYDRLTRVRDQNDLSGWLHFFLDGVAETAKNGVETFNAILQLKQHWDTEIASWKPRTAHGPKLFTRLFTHPWVNAAQVSQVCAISPGTAYSLIERFVACGILREITGAKRGKLYIFDPYLKLFR